MGANHSKQQQGVLAQMKGLLSPRREGEAPVVAPDSAPPTPRSLADSLRHPQLQQELLAFLRGLDTASAPPPGACGRAACLGFVVELESLVTEGASPPPNLASYFPTDPAKGLVLNNDPGLWQRCAEAARSSRLTEDGKAALLLAREHCMKQLARMHQDFLVERAEARTTGSSLAACCGLF